MRFLFAEIFKIVFPVIGLIRMSIACGLAAGLAFVLSIPSAFATLVVRAGSVVHKVHAVWYRIRSLGVALYDVAMERAERGRLIESRVEALDLEVSDLLTRVEDAEYTLGRLDSGASVSEDKDSDMARHDLCVRLAEESEVPDSDERIAALESTLGTVMSRLQADDTPSLVAALSQEVVRLDYELTETQRYSDSLLRRLEREEEHTRFLAEELRRVDSRLSPDAERPFGLAADHQRLTLLEDSVGGCDLVQRGATAPQICDRILRVERLVETLGAAVGTAGQQAARASASTARLRDLLLDDEEVEFVPAWPGATLCWLGRGGSAGPASIARTGRHLAKRPRGPSE